MILPKSVGDKLREWASLCHLSWDKTGAGDRRNRGNPFCPWAASFPVAEEKAGGGGLAQGLLLGVELTLRGAMASTIPSSGAL